MVANADILESQVRIAALDSRVCLCCIALHGKRYPIGDPILDHFNGRCIGVPVVRGRVLNIETGVQWFNRLPVSQKTAIAGYANYNALQQRAVSMEDFVQEVQNPIFGAMVQESSLVGILGQDAQRYYKNATR
jgi:hypothetical protein